MDKFICFTSRQKIQKVKKEKEGMRERQRDAEIFSRKYFPTTRNKSNSEVTHRVSRRAVCLPQPPGTSSRLSANKSPRTPDPSPSTNQSILGRPAKFDTAASFVKRARDAKCNLNPGTVRWVGRQNEKEREKKKEETQAGGKGRGKVNQARIATRLERCGKKRGKNGRGFNLSQVYDRAARKAPRRASDEARRVASRRK